MSSGTHIIVSFTHHEGDPSEITEALGIEATKQWSRGDVLPPARVPAKNCGWWLDTQSGNYEIEEKLNELLDSWMPLKDQFASLAERWYGEVRCACYFGSEESTPALSFDRTIIDKLAELSLGLDIDLYVLP